MTRHIYIILTAILNACGKISSDKNGAEVESNKIDTSTIIHFTKNITSEKVNTLYTGIGPTIGLTYILN